MADFYINRRTENDSDSCADNSFCSYAEIDERRNKVTRLYWYHNLILKREFYCNSEEKDKYRRAIDDLVCVLVCDSWVKCSEFFLSVLYNQNIAKQRKGKPKYYDSWRCILDRKMLERMLEDVISGGTETIEKKKQTVSEVNSILEYFSGMERKDIKRLSQVCSELFTLLCINSSELLFLLRARSFVPVTLFIDRRINVLRKLIAENRECDARERENILSTIEDIERKFSDVKNYLNFLFNYKSARIFLSESLNMDSPLEYCYRELLKTPTINALEFKMRYCREYCLVKRHKNTIKEDRSRVETTKRDTTLGSDLETIETYLNTDYMNKNLCKYSLTECYKVFRDGDELRNYLEEAIPNDGSLLLNEILFCKVKNKLYLKLSLFENMKPFKNNKEVFRHMRRRVRGKEDAINYFINKLLQRFFVNFEGMDLDIQSRLLRSFKEYRESVSNGKNKETTYEKIIIKHTMNRDNSEYMIYELQLLLFRLYNVLNLTYAYTRPWENYLVRFMEIVLGDSVLPRRIANEAALSDNVRSDVLNGTEHLRFNELLNLNAVKGSCSEILISELRAFSEEVCSLLLSEKECGYSKLFARSIAMLLFSKR